MPRLPSARRKTSPPAGLAPAAAPSQQVSPAAEAQHTENVMSVLRQFRVVFRSVKRHFQWVEEQCGVSGAQLWAIATIGSAPGMKVSELAKALAIHQSTASNMLDRLESSGLVKRERISSDQRVVRLFLTSKGDQVLSVAPQPFQGVLPDALATLPRATLDALAANLGVLIDTMKVKDVAARGVPLSDI